MPHLSHACARSQALEQPQWINCDVRKFDMSILGKFGVIMADPPWEIHQDLPYGTLADDEMRHLNIGCLQDKGVIFLWVTGACDTRALMSSKASITDWLRSPRNRLKGGLCRAVI